MIIGMGMISWYIITRSYIPVAVWMFLNLIGAELTGYYICTLYKIIDQMMYRK